MLGSIDSGTQKSVTLENQECILRRYPLLIVPTRYWEGRNT